MNKLNMPAIHLAALASACPVYVIGMPLNDASDAQMMEKVQAALDKINGETKKTAETALAEAKKTGEVSAETKNAVDKLLTSQTALNSSLAELTNKVEGLAVENKDLAQVVAEGGGRRGGQGPQTLGHAFVANHDDIKAFRSGSQSFDISNAITTADGSAGGLIYHEEEREPVRKQQRRLRVSGLVTHAKVGSNMVTYRTQIIRSSMAAMVAEGAASPESNYAWDKVQEAVKKIGHHINVSEESLADADYLQSEIDTELRYGLALEREKQILAGDGVGENFNGLLPAAPDFVAADAALPNATPIDRLRLALLQIVLEDHIATSMVLNPIDWAKIDLQKDGNGRYIFARPEGQTAPMLWGKDVVESNSQSANEFLVGDLEMAATLYDRQQTEIILSTEHDDNFIKDMVTIKGRERGVLAVKRPLAMVKGNFTFA